MKPFLKFTLSALLLSSSSAFAAGSIVREPVEVSKTPVIVGECELTGAIGRQEMSSDLVPTDRGYELKVGYSIVQDNYDLLVQGGAFGIGATKTVIPGSKRREVVKKIVTLKFNKTFSRGDATPENLEDCKLKAASIQAQIDMMNQINK